MTPDIRFEYRKDRRSSFGFIIGPYIYFLSSATFLRCTACFSLVAGAFLAAQQAFAAIAAFLAAASFFSLHSKPSSRRNILFGRTGFRCDRGVSAAH